MKKAELQQKLRDIHTILTRVMMTGKESGDEIDELIDQAEEKLSDLENEIAAEPE